MTAPLSPAPPLPGSRDRVSITNGPISLPVSLPDCAARSAIPGGAGRPSRAQLAALAIVLLVVTSAAAVVPVTRPARGCRLQLPHDCGARWRVRSAPLTPREL